MKKHIANLALWLVESCYVQLFVTLISLPVLVAWGMPLSILGLAGNIIFSPLLLVFLLVASCIFFLEVVGLPNYIFIYLLENLVTFWSKVITWGPSHSHSLYPLPRPAWWFGPLLLLVVGLVVHHKKLQDLRVSLCLLTFIFAVTIGCLSRNVIINNPVVIPCGQGYVYIFYHKGKAILVDPGFMTGVRSIGSWIDYTLVPEIVKNTAVQELEAVIALKPSANLFRGLEELVRGMPVRKIYVPAWQGFDRRLSRGFFFLNRALENYGGEVICYEQSPCSIWLDEGLGATLLPYGDKRLSYGQAEYCARAMTLYLDDYAYNFRTNNTFGS